MGVITLYLIYYKSLAFVGKIPTIPGLAFQTPTLFYSALHPSPPPFPDPIMHNVDVSLFRSSDWDATLINFLAGTLPPTPAAAAGSLLEGPTVGGEL